MFLLLILTGVLHLLLIPYSHLEQHQTKQSSELPTMDTHIIPPDFQVLNGRNTMFPLKSKEIAVDNSKKLMEVNQEKDLNNVDL